MVLSINQYFSKLKNIFKKDIEIKLSMNYWRESNPKEEYKTIARTTFSELEKEANALRKAPGIHLKEKKFPIIAINIEIINGKKPNYKNVPLDVGYINNIYINYREFFENAKLEYLLKSR